MIRNFQHDSDFKQSFGVKRAPSAEIMCLRMDKHNTMRKQGSGFDGLHRVMPLDIDVLEAM